MFPLPGELARLAVRLSREWAALAEVTLTRGRVGNTRVRRSARSVNLLFCCFARRNFLYPLTPLKQVAIEHAVVNGFL
jgi:hypothetical protein